MVSTEYSEALVEILEILKHTDADLVSKIPPKLINFFEENTSSTYKFDINQDIDLSEINLKEKTKDIIAMLYRNYWCTTEERKEFDNILLKNENEYQEKLHEQYNPDNLFKTEEKQKEVLEEKSETDIIVYNEKNVLEKIIYKLKNIIFKILKKGDSKF